MPSKLRRYRGYAGGECRWPSRLEQRYGPTSVLWGRTPRGSAAMRRTDGRLARVHACPLLVADNPNAPKFVRYRGIIGNWWALALLAVTSILPIGPMCAYTAT